MGRSHLGLLDSLYFLSNGNGCAMIKEWMDGGDGRGDEIASKRPTARQNSSGYKQNGRATEKRSCPTVDVDAYTTGYSSIRFTDIYLAMPREAEPSLSERTFTLQALGEGLRLDGRKLDQWRSMSLQFGDEYGAAEVQFGKTRSVIRLDPQPGRCILTVRLEYSPKYQQKSQSRSQTARLTASSPSPRSSAPWLRRQSK